MKKILVICLLLTLPSRAYALRATAPLAFDNGGITCTNCSTAAGTLTSNAVIIGGGTKAVSAVGINSTATAMYLRQASSGAPAFTEIVIGDLAAMASAALFAKISDETGSGSGTPVAVFSINPALTGVTVTGTAALTGATVNLPSGAVDAIGEIATGIKSGGAAGVLLATTAASLTNGQCVQSNVDGNLVSSGAGCGGTGVFSRIVANSETPVTVTTATPVYMSLGGALSTTEADVRTPIVSTATFTGLACIAKTGTTNAITATLGENACTVTADVATKLANVMSATANTFTADNTGTTIVSGGECAVIKLTVGTDALVTDIVCTLEITG